MSESMNFADLLARFVDHLLASLERKSKFRLGYLLTDNKHLHFCTHLPTEAG
jgi:hypothetical protein